MLSGSLKGTMTNMPCLMTICELPLHADVIILIISTSQGTGAVTLAALMSAVGVTKSRLSDQRIVIYGAGSAGLGIAKQLRDAMKELDDTSKEEANKQFYLIDKFGLVTQSLSKAGKVRSDLDEWLRPDTEWENANRSSDGQISLIDVVKHIKPTVLIGTSTHGGAFSEEVVKEMSKGCDRPIIFPLSNPSKLVEVDPKNANDWSGGKALLATGSPFPPAKMPNGKDYMYVLHSHLSDRVIVKLINNNSIAECNSEHRYPNISRSVVA
jgi:malate dehydrogenase (oxaloacetate-decarboxylating)